jgi:transcriptional regulator with XRE-family HTH domain
MDKDRMRNEVRQQIVAKLSNKEYRDIFVSEQINTGLGFQIQALREQRGWTQQQLGEKAGMAQSRISVMEDANYSRFSLSTLKRLASALDVGLIIRFVSYSIVVDYFENLTPESLTAPSFAEDSRLGEVSPREGITEALHAVLPKTTSLFGRLPQNYESVTSQIGGYSAAENELQSHVLAYWNKMSGLEYWPMNSGESKAKGEIQWPMRFPPVRLRMYALMTSSPATPIT